MATEPNQTTRKQRTLFGHPRGLFVLFLTQMWERFSYYGMLALLIIYMTKHFKWEQDRASSVFKWYTSVIYFTPLIGGFLADRYLGNRRAVLIGLLIMAVGHFLMAFEAVPIFYSALIVLVVGFGLLTPPLTSQVGLLYAPDDARRDSGYTIFYMGINLGAFVSPLICDWLRENTRGGFHTGFTVAGIGMVIGMLTYAVGGRWIIEVDQTAPTGLTKAPKKDQSEETLAYAPSAAPYLNRIAPPTLLFVGGLLAVAAPILYLFKCSSLDSAISFELMAVCALVFAWIASKLKGAQRDRVLAIMLMGFFVAFYWVGAQQGGNVMNLWADQNTDRFLGRSATPPDLFTEPSEDDDASQTEGASQGNFWNRWVNLFKLKTQTTARPEVSWGEAWHGLWNPVLTAWFQSINPLLILLLAPFFAMLWAFLGRRGRNPSIPTKMVLGILFMLSAFVLMMGAAKSEDKATVVNYSGELPAAFIVSDQGQLKFIPKDEQGKPLEPRQFVAGRLRYDKGIKQLHMQGVFTVLDRDRMAAESAPTEFVAQIMELSEQTKKEQSAGIHAQIQLKSDPPGFDLHYVGLSAKALSYDSATRTLSANVELEDKHIMGLKVAAADPQLRDALDKLVVESSAHRVSSLWLIGFFFLATLGEFCLAPIGLSMVSKLAPARYASLLMGLWLLVFSFGNLAAGWLGQSWGKWTPSDYFGVLCIALAGAALLLFVLRRKIVRMMHDGG